MTEFFVEQALKEAIDLHQRNQLDDAKSITVVRKIQFLLLFFVFI